MFCSVSAFVFIDYTVKQSATSWTNYLVIEGPEESYSIRITTSYATADGSESFFLMAKAYEARYLRKKNFEAN